MELTYNRIDLIIARLKNKGYRVKYTGKNSYMAQCPCHEDKEPSLAVSEGEDGRVLLKCFAGCNTEDIVAELGLSMADLFPPKERPQPKQSKPKQSEARRAYQSPTYFYTDEQGKTLFGIIRTPRKDFFAVRPDGNGGWLYGLEGVEPVPYRLPEVIKAVSEGKTVFIVEGEKDADNLRKLGLVATTNHGGAKKWRPHYSDYLVGADVVIIPDNDKPGREHAERVAQSLVGKAKSIRMLELPNLPPKGDVSDWLEAGGTKEELLALAETTAEYEPVPETLPTDTTPNPTDLGNAMRLVALHGEDLRYCYAWGKWLVWDGKRWVIDDVGQVEFLAKDTVRNIYAEAARETSESRRREIAKWALSSESRQRFSAMVALAQSEPGIPIKHDELNRNRWLINCLNGTLDLRTGELKPHDRADLITKIAPVEYRMGAPCPNWLSFLNMIFEGNQDLIAFVQRAVGYSLTGITDERCMFILWGKGKNGKSTFLETIGRMMGDYAEKTTAETLLTTRQTNIPNDIARLQGARFVRASESEHGRYLAEARIKEMTGQDMIAARFLFSEWFSFIPEFKIWLGTNHKPVIRGTDEAIWDRIKLIPFTVRIDNPKPRREIDAMFSEELAGIFSWAVEGCMEWQDHGLGVTEEVRKATAEYRYEMDNIGRFIEECCEVGEYFRTPSSELYEAYKAWAEDVGVEVLSSQSFGRRLTELGFEAQRNTTGQKKWMRQGIRINDD